MCVLCEGGTEDDLFFGQMLKIASKGFTVMAILGEPTWAYTIGLMQSFDHPELVVSNLPECCVSSILVPLTDRIRGGELFDESSPPVALKWGTIRFGPVHHQQWDKGRLDSWLRYYRALGGEPPFERALQVVWADEGGRFPDDPDFVGDQELYDTAPRHNVNTGMNRRDRRRAKYGHGKLRP